MAAHVCLEAGAEWPEPVVPDDLAQALADAPAEIQDMWEDITPMARWEWVRWVQATASETTQARRVRSPFQDEQWQAPALLLRSVFLHRAVGVPQQQADLGS
ncbi:MAG: YdeI/OmpD-associated family protein [Marmoricola sp.]